MRPYYLVANLLFGLLVLPEHHLAELLEGDDPGAVLQPVEHVVDLHLCRVETCSPHGEDERAVGYFSIIIPVESREGFVISLSLFIFEKVQLPVDVEDVHGVPDYCERVHGGTETETS